MDALTFYTVGHSNRTQEEFVTLLLAHSITVLVDVRKLRGSTRHPWTNEDSLNAALGRAGIQYLTCQELAGRRPRQGIPEAINGAWHNQSFHNYADYAMGEPFQQSLTLLERLAHREPGRVCYMCSEAVPWRCHRRLITDHLLARGHRVRDLYTVTNVRDAVMSKEAVIGADGRVTYPVTKQEDPVCSVS